MYHTTLTLKIFLNLVPATRDFGKIMPPLKKCLRVSFSPRDYANDSRFRLAGILLRMESRLFDNEQTGKRSRFSCVEGPNCAHGKHLHFKGLLLACIMFDTGARSSQFSLVETSVSATRGYSPCTLVYYCSTHIVLASDKLLSGLKQMHSFNSSARANCEISVIRKIHSHHPRTFNIKWTFQFPWIVNLFQIAE